MNELDGMYAKLDRARLHARDLKSKVDAALKSEDVVFAVVFDSSNLVLEYRIEKVPLVDDGWSAILGDFLTNIRAALDHLTFQLALLSGGQPTSGTNFPITKISANRSLPFAPLKVPGITDERILEATEALQPRAVLSTRDARTHALHILNTLVNTDKHRVLITAVAALDQSKMFWATYNGYVAPEPHISLAPLKDGDRMAWFQFQGGPPHPDFDAHVGVQVQLDDPDLPIDIRRLSIVDLVNFVYTYVEHVVLDRHFLPTFNAEPRGGTTAYN